MGFIIFGAIIALLITTGAISSYYKSPVRCSIDDRGIFLQDAGDSEVYQFAVGSKIITETNCNWIRQPKDNIKTILFYSPHDLMWYMTLKQEQKVIKDLYRQNRDRLIQPYLSLIADAISHSNERKI